MVIEYQFGNGGQDATERNLEENLHTNYSCNHRDDTIIKNKNRMSRAKGKAQDFMRQTVKTWAEKIMQRKQNRKSPRLEST